MKHDKINAGMSASQKVALQYKQAVSMAIRIFKASTRPFGLCTAPCYLSVSSELCSKATFYCEHYELATYIQLQHDQVSSRKDLRIESVASVDWTGRAKSTQTQGMVASTSGCRPPLCSCRCDHLRNA